MWPCDANKRMTRAGGRGARRRGGPRAGRAFSLAELMIALAILGMGLLVIAAALPAGARYQKQSVDMANGAAAADSALDLIEQNVCLRQRALDASGDLVAPVLFQPRNISNPYFTQVVGQAVPDYEPWIKVRPLFTQNIIAQNASGWDWVRNRGDDLVNHNPGKLHNLAEEAIQAFVLKWGGDLTKLQGLEYDPPSSSSVTEAPWLRPALPALALFYPPVSLDPLPNGNSGHMNSPAQFFAYPYVAASRTLNETTKALERTIVWTAFYRRVSYQTGSDSHMYEVIVVALRRPTGQYRYPVQDASSAALSGSAFATHRSTGNVYSKVDTAAPTPWLVSFGTLAHPEGWSPVLQQTTHFLDDGAGTRVLTSTFVPQKLVFYAEANVGCLLPPGSVIIPAVNDTQARFYNPAGSGECHAGFVPSAPDTLPIFEVAERVEEADGTYKIVPKDNGYYPWLGGSYTSDHWPVWVIPPAVEAVDPTTGPAYPDQSPVLAVARRYICIREFP
jgi:prepilin-type N-terminal cleavage/methylation domain-containing protein